ncbi:Homocysteine S-methyltransferase 1 [Chytriomyces hyalinus]|nr:Homocysteine S-methyltransferase 1 [Chytriomyces hyalinus]
MQVALVDVLDVSAAALISLFGLAGLLGLIRRTSNTINNGPSLSKHVQSSSALVTLTGLILILDAVDADSSGLDLRRGRARTRIACDGLVLFGWTALAVAHFIMGSWDPSRSLWERMRLWCVVRGAWIAAAVLDAAQISRVAASLISNRVAVGDLTTTDWMLLGFLVVRCIVECGSCVMLRAPFGRTGADEESALLEEDRPVSTESTSSWAKTFKHMRQLFPFLMPRGLYLRSMVGLCMGLLVCGRIVNVIVPLQYKMLVDTLTYLPPEESRSPYYAWGAVLAFCSLRYLQSSVGVISSLQSLCWIPVGQFNTREISVQMLRHLHSLSLQFHINRKTGEVLRVMDRGTSSVGSLLNAIVFNIIPIFVDIFIAVFWFIYMFDYLTGLIVLSTMVLYVTMTLDSSSRARAVDSLLNFETVKYYNNENYEVNRFEKSILEYQNADWKSSASLTLLNMAQNTVITVGLACGSLLCAGRVVRGELTVGDFIMFITYIVQLYQPLNFFGTYYRVIQQNFIDMESMFDLLNENAAVKDEEFARDMTCSDGEIKFENVSFAYDARQPALENISFTVPAKTTTALVGQSGSGKSTVFRLLFRFYDPQSGRILIDGQDISKMTQSSLRRAIGVVPQDTVCFNDTIGYNIGYGDTNASTAAIEQAAQKAQIHDKILAFPDGYETKVGERGLRLSGGEKQRVAIARTLLKDPKIILLDEATSALDNTTEALIQRSLTELTSRRTTLVIAHRLSTIVDADCILVMKDGKIVEKGTHVDLLAAGEKRASLSGSDGKFKVGETEEMGWIGTYYQMWMRQLEDPSSGIDVLDGNDAQLDPMKPVMKIRVAPSVSGGAAKTNGGHGKHGGHGDSGGGSGFH